MPTHKRISIMNKQKKSSLVGLRPNWRELRMMTVGSIMVAALIIGLYINNLQWQLILEVRLYYSLLLNTFMVFIVIIYLSLINVTLDEILPWEANLGTRSIAQGIFGIFVAAGLCFTLAHYYFSFHHVPFPWPYYSKILFPFIIVLLVCGNWYFYKFGNKRHLFYFKSAVGNLGGRFISESGKKDNGGADSLFLPDALMFYAENNMKFYIDQNLKRKFYSFALEKVMRKLNKHDYFKINRSNILHRITIERFERDGHSLHWMVVFKPEYAKLRGKKPIAVSRNYLRGAKAWLENN